MKRVLDRGLWVPLALAGFTVAFFWKILFLGRAVGGLDVLEYFFPYRDYAARAIDSGHLPLWNPYIFGGVPFLANIQAAIFYPPSALFYFFDEPTGYTWSIVLHAFLGGVFMYLFGRYSLRLGRAPALIAAVAFIFGGFFGGQIGHLNQFSAAIWLPALLLCWDLAISGHLAYGLIGALAVGLQFLAGHSQESYLMLVALLLYAAFETLFAARRHGPLALLVHGGVLVVMLALGAALAAIQLVPTSELTAWGIRGGGLSYQEATTFSLKGTMLLNALLPPFANRGMVAEPGGTEFLGYIGVLGVILALAALVYGWRRRHMWFFAGLAALALFLALGLQNPLYPTLFRVIPGLNLFRVPARWLFVYSFAACALAGLGADAIFAAAGKRSRLPLAAIVAVLGIAGLVIAVRIESLPSRTTLLSWLLFGIAALALAFTAINLGYRAVRPLAATAVVLLGGELWFASQSLDYNHPTLPQVFDQSLPTLDFLHEQPPGFRAASVAMDTFAPSVEPAARQQYQRALGEGDLQAYLSYYKLREILEPNTTMAAEVRSIDGYDGGLLPLARYVRFKDAFTGQQSAPDDRIRFVIKWLPNRALMDLAGVRYLAMDALNDKTVNGLKLDLSGFMRVNPPQPKEAMTLAQPVQTSSLAVVLAAKVPDGTQPDAVVATLTLADDAGNSQEVPLTAGGQEVGNLPWAEPLPTLMATYPLDSPMTVHTLTLDASSAGADVFLNGLAFNSEDAARAYSPLVGPGPEMTRAFQGDVKLYANSAALPSAFLVHQAQLVPGADEAAAALKAPDFDPARQAVVESDPQPPPSRSLLGRITNRLRRLLPGGAGAPFAIPEAWLQPTPSSSGDQVSVSTNQPERIAVEVQSDQQGFLVLTQSFYPGWQVTVDGVPDRLVGADCLFQAVHLPPGQHHVEFTFSPASVRLGGGISLLALAAVVVAGVLAWTASRQASR